VVSLCDNTIVDGKWWRPLAGIYFETITPMTIISNSYWVQNHKHNNKDIVMCNVQSVFEKLVFRHLFLSLLRFLLEVLWRCWRIIEDYTVLHIHCWSTNFTRFKLDPSCDWKGFLP
jgi:hypothetical protein